MIQERYSTLHSLKQTHHNLKCQQGLWLPALEAQSPEGWSCVISYRTGCSRLFARQSVISFRGDCWIIFMIEFLFFFFCSQQVLPVCWTAPLISQRLCDMFDIRLFLCFIVSTKYQTYSYRVWHWPLIFCREAAQVKRCYTLHQWFVTSWEQSFRNKFMTYSDQVCVNY